MPLRVVKKPHQLQSQHFSSHRSFLCEVGVFHFISLFFFLFQIHNLYHLLKLEMVDVNYQLIQQAAAVIPADELIVRMIQKLDLLRYME